MDSPQWIALHCRSDTSQPPTLAKLTAGICQTCSSTYAFCPNTPTAPEQGQCLRYGEVNVAVFSILAWQSLTSARHLHSFLFKQQVGVNSLPLSCKPELCSCSWQVNVLWNSRRMEIMELVNSSGREWEPALARHRRLVWRYCSWHSLLLTWRALQPPYLVASRSRLQTRSCWGGWSCSPPRLSQGCRDGRRTIRTGWTWEGGRRQLV